MDKDKVIYAICVEDIYTVAKKVLRRNPTIEEIRYVDKRLGDWIDWFDIIENLLDSYSSEMGTSEKVSEPVKSRKRIENVTT